MALLSVITPAYNNADKLRRFLASVESDRQGCTDEIEIIAVDDSSTENLAVVVSAFAGVKYLRLEGHPGPAAARNAGARAARGEYLLFFDSDVVLNGGTLRLFVEHFKRGEAAVAGEYDVEPLAPTFFARFKGLLTESWTPQAAYVSVFALRAAGMRADLFKKVGGFDEAIKTASVEDFEFGERLAKAGIRIYYDPNITVKHFHPGFAKQMRLFYLRSSDWAELFFRRGGKFDNWCASPREGMGSIVGTLFLVAVAAALVTGGRLALYLATFFLVGYLVLNIGFAKIAWRRRGLLFVPIALAVKLPLAMMITAGFVVGTLRSIRRALKRG